MKRTLRLASLVAALLLLAGLASHAAAHADDVARATANDSGPNGSCDRWLGLTPQADGSWVAAAAGNFHQATSRDPKGVLCIRAPHELRIARATYDWDFVAGPWWKQKRSGIHNLGYFFGQRYRSGVIGNVNSTGVRGTVRFMQNYDMPPPHNSNASGSYKLQQGALYHASYTFDAAQQQATLRLYRNGAEVKAISQQTFAGESTLRVTPYGEGREAGLALIAEFGNYSAGRRVPEVPTIGWTYANFRLRLEPK